MHVTGPSICNQTYSCNICTKTTGYPRTLYEAREIARSIRTEGLLYDDVVAKFGPMSRTKYTKILNSQNLQQDWRRAKAKRNERILELCRLGASYEAIAQEIGWSVGTCKRYIADLYEVYCKQPLTGKRVDKIKELAKVVVKH